MLLQNRREELVEKMAEYSQNDICVAFSGGVDSSLLLWLACREAEQTGRKVYAVTFNTRLHPKADVEIARDIASLAGAIHRVVEIDELENPEILDNPPERCYLCKKMLFTKLLEFAKGKGISVVLEGTNSDDLKVYRPGIRAIRELGIISPLADFGFTKPEVRAYAADCGLEVSERPSTPCLATRLPYYTRIEEEVLRRIELGEEYLRRLGFYNVRLRVHGDVARLEIDAADFQKCLEYKAQISEYIKELGFQYAALDLEGFRSGSMDEKIGKTGGEG